jgi:RNA polymerase sigma-70 factor, ECF subfamily
MAFMSAVSVSGAGLITPDERALVEAATKGVEDAWTTLYERHYQAVYRYLYGRTGNPIVAEDLAADVFVAAVSSIARYRGERPFGAWLFGIARNIALDHGRRNGRRSRILSRLWPRQEPDAPDPIESVPSADRLEADVVVERLDLVSAISGLTEDQREVVALRYFAGLSTAETAAVMQRKAAAVYSLHARALIALRGILEPISEGRDEFQPPQAITE